MAGLIYEFIDELKQEKAVYEKLIEFADAKRGLIIKGDTENIASLNEQEEKVVMALKALEKRRTQLMSDIAMILNLKGAAVTITQIEEAVKSQPEEAAALGKIKVELVDVLRKLKILNDENAVLIDNSLEYAQFSINVIQSTMGGQPMTANYGGNEEKRNDSFFDAKQ